jgi:hypothetical protein
MYLEIIQNPLNTLTGIIILFILYFLFTIVMKDYLDKNYLTSFVFFFKLTLLRVCSFCTISRTIIKDDYIKIRTIDQREEMSCHVSFGLSLVDVGKMVKFVV